MDMSQAATVKEFLDELPADRRAAVSAVRRVIRKNLPSGYRERMRLGMITYEVPLKDYPDTADGQPLCYAGLAVHQNHLSLYLMGVCQDRGQQKLLRDGFKEAGKKPDMGKSCIRFRTADDLPLDVIGELVAATPPAEHVRGYERSRRR